MMRLFLILGLMAAALTAGAEVLRAAAPEEAEFFKARYRHVMTTDEMCAALKAQYDHTFQLDSSVGGLDGKL